MLLAEGAKKKKGKEKGPKKRMTLEVSLILFIFSVS